MRDNVPILPSLPLRTRLADCPGNGGAERGGACAGAGGGLLCLCHPTATSCCSRSGLSSPSSSSFPPPVSGLREGGAALNLSRVFIMRVKQPKRNLLSGANLF